MLGNFTYDIPTRIHFGKDALEQLGPELAKVGPTVMLTYGRSSIKKNGIYDKVMAILKEAGKTVVEYSGIKSNPTLNQMLEGARLVRDHKVDFILAVGGGSVIDCAKGISVAAYAEGDPWEKYYVNWEPVTHKVVPIGTVLTMVGTGSEMNGGSVITNEAKKLKNGRNFESNMFPQFSILNPEFTYSVPEYQMLSGIFDAISHLMEQYFAGTDDNVTDYLIEGLLRSLIRAGRQAKTDPHNYEARSNIMWAASLALNTMLALGKQEGDWEVHMIEHQLGAYTDCAHGMGLSAVSVPYYKMVYKNNPAKFVRFANVVWGINTDGMTEDQAALAGINALGAYIKEMGMASNLRELNTQEEMLPAIAESTILLTGGYKTLTKEDVMIILKEAF